jgi:P-type Mg2+ transporter
MRRTNSLFMDTHVISGNVLAPESSHRRRDGIWKSVSSPLSLLLPSESRAPLERIIMALRHSGNTVGFLGDGINDAPALHSCDVGISVNSAVDVAKEAATVVLLEKDLSVLSGVCAKAEERSRTHSNIFS